MAGERWVFVHPQEQILDRKSADLACVAGHQTGVEVRIMALPGEQYRTPVGSLATVPEGKVLIGAGRDSTGSEVETWAKRHKALKKVTREIREDIQRRRAQ